MKGLEGQRADSHGYKLNAQQHGAYPLPGLYADTLDTPLHTLYSYRAPMPCPWQPTSTCRFIRSAPPQRGENAHRDARLARERCGARYQHMH